MRIFPILLLIAALAQPTPSAAKTVAARPGALPKSSIAQAMKDELARSMKLRIPGLPKPYYVSYEVINLDRWVVAAEFGGLLDDGKERSRFLTVFVRVGSYKQDNTSRDGAPLKLTTEITADDNYDVLRRQIWLATDRAYKRAVSRYQRKKAALATAHSSAPHGDNFSKEPTYHTKAAKVSGAGTTRAAARKLARDLSRLMWRFPNVREGTAHFTAWRFERLFLSSEGTTGHEIRRAHKLRIAAGALAKDGMVLRHHTTILLPSNVAMPPRKKLVAKAMGLLKELETRTSAPIAKAYSGPVLFEGAAAAQIVRRVVVPHLSGTPEPPEPLRLLRLYSQTMGIPLGSALTNHLGRRAFSKSFTAYDDPAMRRWKKQAVIGFQSFDAEGVPSKKLSVVDRGKLVTLLNSRYPHKKIPRSNGRAAPGLMGRMHGQITNLVIKPGRTSRRALRKRLVREAKKAGEKFGIVVRLLDAPRRLGLTADSQLGNLRDRNPAAERVLVGYRVYPGGREEMIRGLQVEVKLGAFKRIMAIGKSVNVDNAISTRASRASGGTSGPTTVIAPDLLLSDIEGTPVELKHSKSPLLPRPPAPQGS